MAGPTIPSERSPEPSRAARHLDKLSKDFLDAGSRYTLSDFTSLVMRLLQATPDPDMALLNLVRFSESTVSRTSLFNDLMELPEIAEIAVQIFGSSQYFADILVRDPALFRWLTTSGVLSVPVDPAALAPEINRIEEMFARPERRLDALKRLHRRELVRIGAQDILGEADVSSVTLQLSHLADALTAAVIRVSELQLTSRFSRRPDTPFTVLGLGKLGGRELNYSSDIDVIFLYKDDGTVGGGKGKRKGKGGGEEEFSHHEYFNRLAEKIVQNLSQPTGEGHLFRVDTRLRPESGAGPLARSLLSTLTYYESRGEIWERQMLLKARPVAGDLAFGKEALAQLEPFIYPRTFYQHPADYVARIKARIERATGDDANIKLMAGGIRDIEFIVQTLQLINAGTHPGIRQENTLAALAALAGAGFVTPAEEKTLGEAYRFFRNVEHRLQTMFNTQTHSIPEDVRRRETLARRVGLRSADELLSTLARHLRSVRTIFDQVLSTEGSPGEEGILAVIDGGLPEDRLKPLLGSMGFRDDRQALRNIRLLTAGSALTQSQTLDARDRDAFRSAAPTLFEEISGTPDADLTLANLASVASAQKFPKQFYAMLGDTGFRRFLLDVCKVSPRFARGLARDPLLMEMLSGNVESLASEPEFSRGDASLIAFKNREEVRLGVRYLLRFCTFDALASDLSRLADMIVASVAEDELKRSRLSTVPFALFALGKYGTREMNFDADLDILFVCGTTQRTPKNRIEDAAARIVNRLTEVSAEGKLYDVDTRLRPEGKNAPLVTDHRNYLQYLVSRASLWERQSLTRLRPLLGDPLLLKEIDTGVQQFVFDSPLPKGWTKSIVDMRRKMETRTRLGGPAPLDVKLGEGGMADIEFLTQMFRLRYGGPDLRLRRATRVPDLLANEDLPGIAPTERMALAEAYGLFRHVETLLRITLEEKSSILPDGPALDLIARIMGLPAGPALRERIASATRQTRKVFLDCSRGLDP